eukprot:TRINITY_DN13280_c0_g1_i1.p1 TRINITY_DN13280_c0_g1~~TRINITY_DN13280_c0_g1_i1.p1  ORF type:complete len:216 (-),score=37.53 TRINITY_DN13280_c0_g1_i1:29-676(-)
MGQQACCSTRTPYGFADRPVTKAFDLNEFDQDRAPGTCGNVDVDRLKFEELVGCPQGGSPGIPKNGTMKMQVADSKDLLLDRVDTWDQGFVANDLPTDPPICGLDYGRDPMFCGATQKKVKAPQDYVADTPDSGQIVLERKDQRRRNRGSGDGAFDEELMPTHILRQDDGEDDIGGSGLRGASLVDGNMGAVPKNTQAAFPNVQAKKVKPKSRRA